MSRATDIPAHRVHPARVYSGLKAASADLLEDNGGLDRVAARTRGSAETIRRCVRHEFEAFFLGVDQVADMEARAEHPWVTAALAETAGFLLVPSPDRMKADGLEQRTIKEAAEAITEISKALATDGKIDRTEAPRVRKEVLEAILALFAFDQDLQRRFPDLKPLRLDGIADLLGEAD